MKKISALEKNINGKYTALDTNLCDKFDSKISAFETEI
jgi:hypothetical protein